MDIAAKVQEVLAALGVEHDLIEIDPRHADTEAFCSVYGYPPETSANTIVVASKRGEQRYVACVLLATTRLDVNGVVRKTAGFGKASFADADATAELTGMEIGGVTPFGLPDHLPLYVDRRVTEVNRVIVGGGSRALKVEVAPAALLALPGAQVIDDLAR
jgi:prolyl-tRNA editing enzyme YbaK/EbsC (Cys-tRNA(Pro) deacylase)